MEKKRFYTQLEGLRGMAILLVLLSHFIVVPQLFYFNFLSLGAWGVNLFFVLSGFLITEILLKDIYSKKGNGKILRQFYLKRVLRIFPVYHLSILVLALFKVEHTQTILPYTLTYTYNIANIWSGVNANVLMSIWSLCVEEQFYLVWPLLLILVSSKRHLKLLLLMVFIALVTKSVYYGISGPAYMAFNTEFTPSCFDALGIGSLLAFLKLNHAAMLQEFLHKYMWLPVGMVIVFWMIVYFQKADSWFYQVFARSFYGVAGFFLTGLGAFSIDTFYGKLANLRWLRYVGRISYGVYIYHWIFYYLLSDWFLNEWRSFNFGIFPILKYNAYIGAFLFFSILAIIVASISYYIVEKPLLRLKTKIA